MKTFFDTNISKTKTFVLYGNLKDTIWCPDLIPRDFEHYLVKLLKSRGYEHIIFFGGAGTKGAYCLDEQSARFFFSENEGIPFPRILKEGFEDFIGSFTERDNGRDRRNEAVNDEQAGLTGSQVSDALSGILGQDHEYAPGEYPGENDLDSAENFDSENSEEVSSYRVRYSYRGQTMSEFLQKINPLMLKKESHMAVVFYNILTTDCGRELQDNITHIWENNSKGNICLMLVPETSYNETALVGRIRQYGLESKFLQASSGTNQMVPNPMNCFKICRPGVDELKHMLRYLALVGNETGKKIHFKYSEINALAEHILLASKVNASRMNREVDYMSEIYKRICEFIEKEYLENSAWDGRFTCEEIDRMYNTKDLKSKAQDPISTVKDAAPDWAVERLTVEIPVVEEEKTLEQLLEELDELVGLANVKKEIKSLIALQQTNKWRKEHGLPISSPALHMVFNGDPGTGKTVVARILGKIYRALGILSRGHLIEVGRENLVGQYVGHTAQKTKEVIDSAMGGVLFIDEAYTLSDGGEHDFGKEAIDTLVRHMENQREDLVIIIAGYPEKMKQFIHANDGLQSRFTKNIDFENYTIEELMEILKGLCKKGHYYMDNSAHTEAQKILKLGQKYGGRNFGNGRYVRNVYESAISNLAVRVSGLNTMTLAAVSSLTADDFLLPTNIHVDLYGEDEEKTTEKLLEELDRYIGLQEVKVQVRKLINQVKMNKKKS